MAKKRKNWFKTTMAWLGGAAVLAGLTFSIMWFVPSIHDKIWVSGGDQQQTEQEQNTNTETDNTNKE